jgi:hypothetical protein
MLLFVLLLLRPTWQPGQQWRAILHAEQRFWASCTSDSRAMLLHGTHASAEGHVKQNVFQPKNSDMTIAESRVPAAPQTAAPCCCSAHMHQGKHMVTTTIRCLAELDTRWSFEQLCQLGL